MRNAVIVTILTCAITGSTWARNVDECLSKLEDGQQRMTSGELQECVETIRAGCAAGDEAMWKRLRAIVSNDALTTRVRVETLKLACEKADERIASEILGLATAWALELDTSEHSPEELTHDRVAGAKSMLVSTLVLDGLTNIQRVVADQKAILDFVAQVAVHVWCSLDAKNRCYRVIAESPAPIEERRACALQIITEEREWQQIPGPFRELLDRSAFPRLRELVRQSSDPDKFHFAAAAVLGHLGDREIVSDFEALRPAFRKKHVNIEGMLVYYLWQIDVQNPPSKLTDYIASPPEVGVERRLWAIRRATELGVPKPQIRKAILAHAEQVKPNALGIRPGLASIKMLARSLGILEPTDFPDVKTPSAAPTP